MNYTKGEWEINRLGKIGMPHTYQIFCDGYKVAGAIFNKANANLIAAAPDMYEALKSVLPLITTEWNGPLQERARQALAKAEGK